MKRNRLLISVVCGLLLLSLAVGLCACGSDGYQGGPEPQEKWSLSEEELEKGLDLENRKIIKTVNETVCTEQFDAFVAALQAAVKTAGGYISSTQYNGSETHARSANYVIRVPAENLDGFSAEIASVSTVQSHVETADDVTEAYVDIESRIAVLEAEETSLLEMLAKAQTMQEILELRTKIESLQEDLASYRARLRTMASRVAYSTYSLYVYEVVKETTERPGFFEEIGTTFLDCLATVGDFFRGLCIGLIGGSPIIVTFLILPAGIFLLIFFLVRHKNKNKKQ